MPAGWPPGVITSAEADGPEPMLTELGLQDRARAVIVAYESGLVTPG